MEFIDFIHQLETPNTKHLIESIEQGYTTIFEGWCDVRNPDRENAITTYSRKAAQTATSMGIPVLQKLNEWSKERESLWSDDDEEEELDNIDTMMNFRHKMARTVAPATKSPDSHLGIKGVPLNGF